jgi:hypothetical protein
MLPAALRRSMVGRWKTMAHRGGGTSAPPQVMRPLVGRRSPMASRKRVLLPAPLGPINTVMASVARSSETASMIASWRTVRLT